MNTTSNGKSSEQKRTLLPNPGDIFFVTILFLLLVKRPTFLFGDGGTGWHLTTGHYIIDHFKLPTTDFISYFTEGKPWIPLYWFADLLLAIADRLAGLNGVALFSAAIIGLTVLLLYRRARQSGCHMVVAAAITGVGTIASAVHWFARPHLLAFIGTYLFATELEDYYRKKITSKRLIITLVLVTIIWTNSHPSFAAGLVLTGIYFAVSLFRMLFSKFARVREIAKEQAAVLGTTLAACTASTLLHPSGFAYHILLLNYLSLSRMVEMVKEYQSPKFHGAVEMTSLELLFLFLVVGLMLKKKFSIPHALCCLAFAHLSLSGVRYMPLFVIVAVPFIAELFAPRSGAPEAQMSAQAAGGGNELANESAGARGSVTAGSLSDTAGSVADPVADQPATTGDVAPSLASSQMEACDARQPWSVRFFGALVARWNRLDERMDVVEKSSNTYATSWVALIAFAVVVGCGGTLGGTRLVNAGFDPLGFPTTNLDYIKTHKLPVKKGFNEANWGGYIFYKSGLQVFIDDRVVLYGEDFYLLYASVINLAPGWKQFLDKYQFEWVLFPKVNIFTEELQMNGWKVLAEDPASVVLQRPAASSPSTDKNQPLPPTNDSPQK